MEEVLTKRVIPAWAKRSAIIGYYRQGMTAKEIGEIMGIIPMTIADVINEYLTVKYIETKIEEPDPKS